MSTTEVELGRVQSRTLGAGSFSPLSEAIARGESFDAGPRPTATPSEPTAAVENDGGEGGTMMPEEDVNSFPKMTKSELQLTFISLSVIGFLSTLDMSIVATAMPTIASEFNSLSQQSWIALSYLITSTVFQPLFGRATDLVGCRSVLFASVFVFELGSLLCALAENFVWLCCARAVAGIGGAGIMVVIMVIVSQIVPIRERGKYTGILYARLVVAAILGPIIGGLFAGWNWRWCFWINLIIAVPAVGILLAFAKKLPHTVKEDISWRDIDFGGVLTLGIAVVSLCLAFNWGGTVYAWNSPIVIALLAAGFAFVPIFVLYEVKVPSYPLIPMKMFRFRNVTTSIVTNFFTAASLQGVFIYLPSYFQIVRHDKQIISSLGTLPYVMPLMFTSVLSGMIIARTGAVRPVLWTGGVCNLAGTALLIMLNGNFPRAVEYLVLVIAGLGAGFLIQTVLLSAQSQVGRDLLATVTTMTLWSRNLGVILGVAMQGSIITNLFRRGILVSSAAAPYVSQLLAVENVDSLPADVQSIAAHSYGAAFQMMVVATTVFCTPGLAVSLIAKKEKLN